MTPLAALAMAALPRRDPAVRPDPAARSGARVCRARRRSRSTPPIALAPAPGVAAALRHRRTAPLGRAPGPRLSPSAKSASSVRVAPLDPARMLAAMQTQLPAARIELLDYSRQPVPEGVLEFPLSGLRPPPAGGFWTGAVRYGGRHRLRRLGASEGHGFGAARGRGGRPQSRAADRCVARCGSRRREEFPSAEPLPASIEEIAGKVLRRPVRAGTADPRRMAGRARRPSRAAKRCRWKSREGGALLQVPGQAQGSGAVGQTILVLNPSSNKRFPARVEAAGQGRRRKGILMKRFSAVLVLAALAAAAKKKPAAPPASPLDRYVHEAEARSAEASSASAGSIWLPGSRLADAARDVRASQIDDLLTIVVAEQASAVTSGTTKTQRTSSAKNNVTAARRAHQSHRPAGESRRSLRRHSSSPAKAPPAAAPSLSTTLTARVVHVLPNGALVVEAAKDIQINSERQTITVRGVVRPADIDATNSVRSNRLGQLEVRVNGKGVVGDAVRRPFFLYRLLLGLLPF